MILRMMSTRTSFQSGSVFSCFIGSLINQIKLIFFRDYETTRLRDFEGLVSFLIDVVYSEEGTCKGCNFAKANEEGLMDLALWLYEDAAEEEDKAAKG